jgi:ubiquinone/menaquinone biosynthesis C-methylase UbiE
VPATTLSTSFWDRIADRYAKMPVADETVYESKLAITRRYFHDDAAVLEVGCGTGTTAIRHAPHVAYVHATDISARMIEIANQRADRAGVDNVTFEQAALEDIDMPDASADVVLALSLLHLVADRDAAIANLHRWLKPGGVLVTSTICLGDNMRWFRFVAPVGTALGLMPMVRVFRMDDLRHSLANAGLVEDIDWPTADGRTLFAVWRKPS